MTYKDKLLDPKWQKKRLKILERDDFSCKICNDKEKTLHVHHLEYNNNGEPWDIKDESLITYCCDCHKLIEYINKYDERIIHIIKVEKSYVSDDFSYYSILNNNSEGEISIAIYSVYLGEIFPSIHLREKTIEKLDKMIKDVKRPSIPVL